jgi:hypothetical protein
VQREGAVSVDVRAQLLAERRRLLPWESEADARLRIEAVSAGHTPNELSGLLTRIRRTGDFDKAVSWFAHARKQLPRKAFEMAMVFYRDSIVLDWKDCVRLAGLMTWTPNATPANNPGTGGGSPGRGGGGGGGGGRKPSQSRRPRQP